MNNEIGLQKLKEIQLELLIAVDEICNKQQFRYSLGGGTLLGAVRHEGYIPWDDDIDIMMPRPDYDAFLEYCSSNNDVPFKFKSWENDEKYVDLSAKIYNPNTILEDNNIKCDGENIGVFIDIFPIEGLGNTYSSAVKAFRATSFKREMLVAAAWKTYFRSKTRPWYYEPIRFVFFILSRFVNKKRTFKAILKKYKKINFNKANFVAAVGGAYREKEILPREIHDEYVSLPFEGRKFSAIARYKEYLTSIYGDYNTLPPEEKRVSHHTFKAYYKEQ